MSFWAEGYSGDKGLPLGIFVRVVTCLTSAFNRNGSSTDCVSTDKLFLTLQTLYLRQDLLAVLGRFDFWNDRF